MLAQLPSGTSLVLGYEGVGGNLKLNIYLHRSKIKKVK